MTHDTRSNDERQSDLALSGAAAPPKAVEPDEGPIGTFHAFRFRNYRLLWLGDLFAATALWTQQTALGWVVYDLTKSGEVLGAVNAVRIIPTLFLTPVAGVATDRYSRNRIIAVSQFSMFLMTLVLATALAFHWIQIWHLFLFSILAGAAQTFNMPARQTFVFELVPRRVIPNAVALSWLAFSLARSIGPAVGGLLIVILGPAENFFLQALAFLGVMTTIVMVRAPARVMPAVRKGFFQSLSEGYSFAYNEPRARILVLMSIISPLFIIPLHSALLPIFADQSFHSGAGGLGILVGSIGFGGLFGGLLTASLNRVDRRGLLQLSALFIFSLSETIFSILAWYTGNLYLAVPFLVLAGVAESVYATTNTAVLQLLAPEHLRGSMAALLQLSFLFITAFSVGLSILLLSPHLRGLRMSELTQTSPARRP
ncbi:MAG: MFS transporter [Chloroflexi bacterium]|nr:MFS transporter [Chloroflexota bacterium]